MNQGVLIARLAGVRIRAHWSVVVIAALLTWGLGAGVIPVALPRTPAVVAWLAAAVGALLLIASLTAHELAHSIVARRRGVQADDITLWVFGGVSHIRGDWQSARTELLVAAAGPLVTFVVAVLCFAVSEVMAVAGAPDLLVLLAQWLAAINATLLVFNLIPAFPLDGGRILRSALWARRHDRSRATVIAAQIGRAFGFLIVGLGMLDVLLTGSFGGVWLMLIGWFLAGAARNEQRGEAVRASLAGARVAEVMSINPATVPSWVTVDLFLKHYASPARTAYPTNGLDGRVDGLVTVNALRRVPPSQRTTRRLSEVFVPVDQVPAARPDELVTDALTRVGRQSEGHTLVFDGERFVGVISPADIGRRIQFGVPKPPPLSTPAPGLPPVV
ncbi:MAG: site-2 protease family protein [Candidatus Dormibacteraeota bacterium]|nr:site-2 protease family protein [Candidatus Dormibacteraeota bacterium]